MRRPYARLATACAFAVALTAFTGGALAGNVGVNDTAPPVAPPVPRLVQVTGDILGAQVTLTPPSLIKKVDRPTFPFTG
jgi:hypothetical protein